MEDEERKAIHTALSTILADLRELKMQSNAAIKVLGEVYPDLFSRYRQDLDRERATTVNEDAALFEYLNKTLRKNTN